MGSFPSDITFKVNIDPASAIAKFKQIEEAFKKGSQGIAGEYEKGAKMAMNMAKQMIDTSNRAGRQLETQLRSIEKQTQSLGKSATEMNEIQRKWMLERARGLKNEEEQEKRINAIYDQRKKFFQEEERRNKAGPNVGNLLFRGARDIFEGRMSYGIMDIGRAALGSMQGGGGAAGAAAGGAAGAGGAGLLAGIPAATLAIGGLTAGLLGVEVAGFAAAKAIGEYGREVHDAQIKTGMTAVEVQRLQFAAQVTGQDISVVDRMFRGLTVAIEGTDKKAFAAAKTLQDMGGDLVALQRGEVKPMELFQQISDALEKQPNKWLRNKEAIDLFGRAGIQSLPMITELNKALRESGKLDFLNQDAIDRMEKTNIEIVRMETGLKLIKLRLEELIAKPFIITIELAGKLGDLLGKGMGLQEKGQEQPEIPEDLIGRFRDAMAAKKAEERAPYVAAQEYAKELQKNNLEAAEQELSEAKQLYDEDLKRAKLGTVMIDQLKEHEAAYKKIRDHVEALRRAESDRKTILESLARAREEGRERVEHPFAVPAQQALDRILSQRGLRPGEPFAYLRPQFEEAFADRKKQEEQERADKIQRQMMETRQTVAREMGRARLGGVEAVNVRQLGVGGVTREDVERDITAQQQQRRDIAMETFTEDIRLIQAEKIGKEDVVSLARQQNEIVAATGKLATAQIAAEMTAKKEMYALDEKERDDERKHRETMSKIQLADQEESIKHEAQLAEKRAQLRFRGDNPAAGIVESYRIAVELSERLFESEMTRIALFETGDKAKEDRAIALHKLHRDDEHASEEAQFKLAEMQQQQLDKLKSTLEPLYHTLFTDPRKFGTQLRGTLQEAALHPIVSGLSEMTATALHPLIYGAGGTGGIAGSMRGIFGGGRLNDAKVEPDGSLRVHVTNLAGGGGVGGGGGIVPAGTNIFSTGSFFSGGGTAGGPSGDYRETFGLAGRGGLGTQFRRFITGGPQGASAVQEQVAPVSSPAGYDFGFSPVSGGGYSGGGPPSVAQLANLPMQGGGTYGGMHPADIAMLGVAASLGGGGGGGTASGGRGLNLGGFANMAKDLRTNWQMALGLNKSYGTTGQMLKGIGTSPLARAGAGTVGMMLAQSGLLGNARGTGKGVLEGTLGGAGVGFSIGGPLGAGIGAAVGLGIGLGEMIAGVESPQHEAIRLVKSVYHIDVNPTTADQIVGIANQSYGGRVSVAIRSPEVRHMLGLYAAGTGQGSVFQQSANEAHGASLVESGGRLQQQATYQYGQAFVQSSNLPVYGGVPAQTYPGGAGGMQLSLNIGGQDAARFMSGQVVSPDVIQSQFASAMHASSGRVSQALLMNAPGSIAS